MTEKLKIGDRRTVNGKLYEVVGGADGCEGCAFQRKSSGAPHPTCAIIDCAPLGGYINGIWKLVEEKPEPTPAELLERAEKCLEKAEKEHKKAKIARAKAGQRLESMRGLQAHLNRLHKEGVLPDWSGMGTGAGCARVPKLTKAEIWTSNYQWIKDMLCETMTLPKEFLEPEQEEKVEEIKAGDWVECVSAYGTDGLLSNGEKYKVLSVRHTCNVLALSNSELQSREFAIIRFRKTTPPEYPGTIESYEKNKSKGDYEHRRCVVCKNCGAALGWIYYKEDMLHDVEITECQHCPEEASEFSVENIKQAVIEAEKEKHKIRSRFGMRLMVGRVIAIVIGAGLGYGFKNWEQVRHIAGQVWNVLEMCLWGLV